jgi:hypothetical protein
MRFDAFDSEARAGDLFERVRIWARPGAELTA